MVSKGNRREVKDKGDGISLALKEVEFGSLKSQKVVGEVASCGWKEASQGWKGKDVVREGEACPDGVSAGFPGLGKKGDAPSVAKSGLGSGMGCEWLMV